MIKIKGIIFFLIVTSTFNVYANDIDVFVNPGRDVVIPVELDGIAGNNLTINGHYFWAHERVGTGSEYGTVETRGNITLRVVGTESSFSLFLNGNEEEWNCNYRLGTGATISTLFPGHGLQNNLFNGWRACGANSHRLGFHVRNALGSNYRVNYETKVNFVQISVPENLTTQRETFTIFHRIQRNAAAGPGNIGTADTITVHIIQNTCTFGTNNADIDINVGDVTPGKDGPRTPLNLDLNCHSENNEVGTVVDAGSSNDENTMLASYRIEENTPANVNDLAANVLFFRPNNDQIILGHVYDDIFELNNLEYQVKPSQIDEFDPHDNTVAQFGAFTRSYNVIIDYF
ncbi:hypothetical protein C0W92_09445 [Photobacterium angustum]|uniref:hypothetical protein n=1 Tax=Photobacterium angustum TaxID=661 RepID=UPI0005DE54B5|nr:hypothetical protein [Photobacterium angustum]KJG31184.1 hypothetical protein UA69_09035 [Photobacterium angustum]PSW90243.1 hypothetical protein C0W92_09445 [Photobacterium angustum]